MFTVRGGSFYSALAEQLDNNDNNTTTTTAATTTTTTTTTTTGSSSPPPTPLITENLGKGALFSCDQALDTNRKPSLITPTTTTTTNTTTTSLTHITTTNNINNNISSGGNTPGLRFQSSSLDSGSVSIAPLSGRVAPLTATTATNTSHHHSHGGKHSNSSPLSLSSLKAAWKSLTSITSSSSSSKLPHLERQTDNLVIHSSSGSSSSSSGQLTGSHPHHLHHHHHHQSQDYRYTQVPSTGSGSSTPNSSILCGNKRHKDGGSGGSSNSSSGNALHQTLHNTHIYLTPATRSYTHPHKSPLQPPPSGHHHHHHNTRVNISGGSSSGRTTSGSQTRSSNFSSSSVSRATGEALTLAKCLRKHKEKQQKIHEQALTRKSKSDNALQKIGVNLKSRSDQNLHKVWLVGACGSQASCCATNNSIFSTVQLSGGSGDSSASVASNNSNSSYRKRRRRLLAGIGLEEEIRRREEQEEREERSRSLERNHCHRIHSTSSSSSSSNSKTRRHTRSLERNHKFRVDLRNLIQSPPLCHHIDPTPPDHPAPSPPTHTAPFIPNALFHNSSSSSSHHSHSFNSSTNSPSLPSYSSSSHSSSNTYSPTPHDLCSPPHCRPALCAMESTNGGGGPVQGGSFINKPARGWLHSDTQLAAGGVSYGVRYIGCLEVNTSMKSLNFDTRSLIAKECISRVCEAAGLKTADRRRKVMKTIGRILGETPLMENAGSNVNLTITSTALTLTLLDTTALIAHHDMPNISFASGGDPDTLDFIAYVAKDCRYGRACFVLECGGGQAQHVITSIGQAFELRFKEYLKKTPQPATGYITPTSGTAAAAAVTPVTPAAAAANSSAAAATGAAGHLPSTNLINTSSSGQASSVHYTTVNNTDRLPPGVRNDDPEYYNDLPGKVPPDLIPPTSQPPPVPPLPNYTATTTTTTTTSKPLNTSTNNIVNTLQNNICSDTPSPTEEVASKILNNRSSSVSSSCPPSDVTSGPPIGEAPRPPSAPAGAVNLIDLCPSGHHSPSPVRCEPEYVNDSIIKKSQQHDNAPHGSKDPFDMQPFNASLNQLEPQSPGPKCLSVQQRMQLAQELWYHGPITRKQSEDLLVQDGDFLVRESQGTAGQFVLTGMQNSTKKHLLLVDPNGVVRTKCQTFSSVSHLINYHRDNELPIVSAESALVLRYPVVRRATPPQPR